MGKIIIFYKYIEIENPHAIQKWQRSLCERLNLKGRILLGHEGINATIGGSVESLRDYKKALLEHPLFSDVDVKESDGDSSYFPRLRIVVRDEIVRMGIDPKKITARDGGKHITPQQVHTILTNKPDNLIVLDARNSYESKVGSFVDAIKPPIDNFRQLPTYIDENLDLFKDKQVLMYCTGGIRCERASAYLKSKGVTKEVYQINGGIHRYVEEYPEGFFRGKNYVFDGRVTVKINNDIVGRCDLCSTPYDEPTNCINASCNKQFIACPPCLETLKNTCDHTCLVLVSNNMVRLRTIPTKIPAKPC